MAYDKFADVEGATGSLYVISRASGFRLVVDGKLVWSGADGDEAVSRRDALVYKERCDEDNAAFDSGFSEEY